MAHIHNSPHNQKILYNVWTNTAVEYGHLELSCQEKSKFEHKEKKVQFSTESWVLKPF